LVNGIGEDLIVAEGKVFLVFSFHVKLDLEVKIRKPYWDSQIRMNLMVFWRIL